MKHQSFVDWMKAVGMLLIVTGHVYGDPYHIFNSVSQPIYTKQLGVAFFVFITGWSLANETRHGLRAIYNRIFPVYFYGFSFAVLLSTIYVSTGTDINESNYLPFIGGINVFFNYFPANPTTWYIGTYLHLLLLWFFLLQGRKIDKQHLIIAFIFENTIRCILILWNQEYIAYMLFPNWLTIFLLGGYLHKKRDKTWNKKTVYLCIIWAITLALWSSSFNLLPFDQSFPFRELLFDTAWQLPLRSLLISALYLASTLVAFEIARCLPYKMLISFFARNTLIIFIVHMPILYALHSYIYDLIEIYWLKKVFLVSLLFVSIALASELIQRYINIKYLRDDLWAAIQRKP